MSNIATRKRFVTAGCVPLLLATFIFPSMSALAHPSTCKPAPGATRSCVSKIPTPYVYAHPNCDYNIDRTSEGAALQDYIDYAYSGSSICNLEVQRLGWLTSQEMYNQCAAGSNMPAILGGLETQNASKYIFKYDDCQNGQHTELTLKPVKRVRTLSCPDGYQSGGDHCYRESNQKERHRNLGSQCPTCGNPISLGIGGKYQKETDYVGQGRLPLEFTRHYNNLLTGNSWYAIGGFSGTLAQRAGMASNPDEAAYQAIGLDRMGVMWRHTYQRAVVLRETTGSTGVATAAVYRDDGRVYAFTLYNGMFVPDADVNDKLARLTDNTWRYTTANGEQIEEFDASGRLTRISDRTGLSQLLTYDACGLLRTVTDQFGRSLVFDYTHACEGMPNVPYRISSVTDPAGATYSYEYDADGVSVWSWPHSSAREPVR